MSLELNGKLKVLFDTQSFPSGFTKREFVITTEEQYPQDVKFELVKDKTSMIDKFRVGDQLKVSFNVRGNEYQGKYFVSLQAWRIENIGAATAPSIPAPLDPMAAQPRAAAPAPSAPIDDIGEDDLPF
jgi:single-strand DNA-binding protein